MSKQSEAKKEQKYQKWGPMCSNCINYTSEMRKITGAYGTYKEEGMKRCSMGNFAVNKTAWCKEHSFRNEP